jgi:hypothetical protein
LLTRIQNKSANIGMKIPESFLNKFAISLEFEIYPTLAILWKKKAKKNFKIKWQFFGLIDAEN